MNEKCAYVCAPLTELPLSRQQKIKVFYTKIADIYEEVTGERAFVPHEHYDPIRHARFTPREVDNAERHQVCDRTSLLIVVAVAPSWGGGIEVEMANQNGIPVLILCEREKLVQGRISRLLKGNPAVIAVIDYETEEEALGKFRTKLETLLVKT